MKIILTETQYKNLIESKGDIKSFLKSQLGLDFTDSIKQITSTYDVPMSFDDCVGWETIKRWMNFWGPLYLFEYDDVNYLYQDRGSYEFFIGDDNCYEYVDNEIPEKLGIAEMGFSFSDILNMYFEEEEL